MNKMNTATVGLAVTPTVLSTFISHVSSYREIRGRGRGRVPSDGRTKETIRRQTDRRADGQN